MRIVSGHYRNRAIRTVTAEGMRPATAKVREALFSALEARGMDWDSARVLDLYAGSGSLGFEALSRGAALAIFVEKHPSAAKAILGTCKDLGIPSGKAVVRTQDVLSYLAKSKDARDGYDCIFIDPPYHKSMLAEALAAVASPDAGWLAAEGLVVAEVEARLDVATPSGLSTLFDRTYGQTRILIWNSTPTTPPHVPADASPSTPAPSTP